jgi:hypothetical protein
MGASGGGIVGKAASPAGAFSCPVALSVVGATSGAPGPQATSINIAAMMASREISDW